MTSDVDYIEFQQLWPMLKRRVLPAVATFALVAGSLSFLAYKKAPSYSAEGKLLIKGNSDAFALTGVADNVGNVDSVVDRGNPLLTEAEIIRSNSVIQKTVERLKGRKPFPITTRELLDNLTVSAVKSADVLRISYSSPLPDKSVQVVNTLMDAYLQEHIRLQKDEAIAAETFLEDQISDLRNDISLASAALRNFKDDNQVPLLSAQAESTLALSQEIEQRMSTLLADIANSEAQAEMVQTQLGMPSDQALVITELGQSPAIQNLLLDIQSVEAELANTRSKYKETHPTTQTLRRRLSNLSSLLQSRAAEVIGNRQDLSAMDMQIGELDQSLTTKLITLEAQRLGQVRELESLLSTGEGYRQWISSLPALEQQQQALEQRLTDARSTYEQLLPRLEESRRAANQSSGNVKIISEPTIADVTGTSKKFLYLVSNLLGLLAAGAVVYLLENKDRHHGDVPQIQQLFELPTLGVIPQIRAGSSRDVLMASICEPRRLSGDSTSISSVEEACRILRINLKSQHLEKGQKVFVFTSAVDQEGTSTICAVLANAMARIGYKTLLIEANFRNPQQSEIWDIPAEKGLCSVLKKPLTLTQSIHPVEKNLDLLPAGLARDLPADLLDSPAMGALLAHVREAYDCVFVDAPALEAGADAIVLGHLADTVLLTVRPDFAGTSQVNSAKNDLAGLKTKELALIVNASSAHSQRYKII